MGTSKTDNATPRPWTICNHNDCNCGHYDGYLNTDLQAGADLIRIRQSVAGKTFPELSANVHLIVRAVNAHDDLVAACQDVLEVYPEIKDSLIGTRLCAVLAKARGE